MQMIKNDLKIFRIDALQGLIHNPIHNVFYSAEKGPMIQSED